MSRGPRCLVACFAVMDALDGAASKEDILDEVVKTFRANVFFRNFEIKGPADRILIYLTLYVTQCLATIRPTMGKDDAKNALYQLAISNFAIPGDGGFPLSGFFKAPSSRAEGDQLRQAIQQYRWELGIRLVDAVYQDGKTPSKWWMCFTKRKFLNKTMA